MCPITRRLIDKLTLVEIKMLILSLTNAVSGYAKRKKERNTPKESAGQEEEGVLSSGGEDLRLLLLF
ncbi:hypothetical protein Peur_050144 [Populus x canadensis]